jgi:hypothetical protein
MSVEVTGITELISTLEKLPSELEERVRNETWAAAREGLEVAQRLSPVRTGYFRSRWQVRASVGGNTPTRIGVELANDASYAAPLIFGHRTRSGTHVAPRNCLTPAQLMIRQSLAKRYAQIQVKGRV